MEAASSGVTGSPSAAMEESTSLRLATLESMIALATRLAYLSCFSCSTGSPLLMTGPPKVIQSRKSLKDSILVVSARMVRRGAHRRGGLKHRSHDQAFPRFGVGHDIEMDAHRGPVAIECLRAGLLGDQRRRISQSQLHRQMLHGVAVHLDRRREAAEILAGLQQRRQRQTA